MKIKILSTCHLNVGNYQCNEGFSIFVIPHWPNFRFQHSALNWFSENVECKIRKLHKMGIEIALNLFERTY